MLDRFHKFREEDFNMMVQNLPSKGDKLFLMNREVVVLNAYAIFGFIKIRYAEETFEFIVDVCAITNDPDYTSSLSIRLFGKGDCSE